MTHWEELHSQVQVTPRLSVRTVTAVPDVADPERFQIYARQELRSGFALQADYGRISAYQPVPAALDRQRLKVMVFKTLNLATPAGGAELTGRVLDYQGRGVAGARVRVGAFTAETNGSGAYRISHLPAGEYRVSLIADQLPASFAWDGREQLVTLTPRAHAAVDLRATPLNSLVGHVFVDRNGNRRVDAGEGITGAVVAIGERISASDEHGAYGFSNLAPGDYLVRIVKMPSGYQLADRGDRSVNLTDTAPLVGIDFAAVAVAKPIRWETSLR
jgi:hypothetical protein